MQSASILQDKIVVSAEEMRAIEARIFDRGMPVSALMEKAAGLCFQEIITLYPLSQVSSIGIVVGSGHNGGDALVIARELYLAGYEVKIYQPLSKLKELTAAHAKYAASLGIPFVTEIAFLGDCELVIDGLFGFGLTRAVAGKLAKDIEELNSWQTDIVSIDLPSGIHTDTGEVLGVAVKANHTLCLGLWKRAFFQDDAIAYFGKVTKLDFGIPEADIKAIIGEDKLIQCFTNAIAKESLPLPRPLVTHKYQQGNLLLIAGSRRYAGAAILNALGARASGIGMLTIAVPESLRDLLIARVPEALVLGCPETPSGAIQTLPLSDSELSRFDAIAAGSGLTTEAQPAIERLLNCNLPLVLDADALNILAQLPSNYRIINNQTRILTPHLGEFKRLFPEIANFKNRIQAAQQAAQSSNCIILLKGSRTVIAHPDSSVWLIPESTPALARGGSGDVLTGLLGGLITQQKDTFNAVATAAWWHAQAGIKAARARTELGVDAVTLARFLYRLTF